MIIDVMAAATGIITMIVVVAGVFAVMVIVIVVPQPIALRRPYGRCHPPGLGLKSVARIGVRAAGVGTVLVHYPIEKRFSSFQVFRHVFSLCLCSGVCLVQCWMRMGSFWIVLYAFVL